MLPVFTDTLKAQHSLADAFNEWMRRYTEDPERFEAQFRTCGEFIAQAMQGEEPTYGHICQAYLEQILADLNAATDAAEAPK